jgi:hypothetical protein
MQPYAGQLQSGHSDSNQRNWWNYKSYSLFPPNIHLDSRAAYSHRIIVNYNVSITRIKLLPGSLVQHVNLKHVYYNNMCSMFPKDGSQEQKLKCIAHTCWHRHCWKYISAVCGIKQFKTWYIGISNLYLGTYLSLSNEGHRSKTGKTVISFNLA